MIIDPIGKSTYKDYLTYEENERIELIEGEIYNMAPAPSRIHQKLINELSYLINHHIKSNNGPCEVYTAPFDVILNDSDNDIFSSRNVVQPDISVICDKNKLTDKGCVGSPDMIIEVVSPYNSSTDYVKKTYIYELYGVTEYWIIDPMKKAIIVYILEDNAYNSFEIYSFNDKIKVGIFKDLVIDFSAINLY